MKGRPPSRKTDTSMLDGEMFPDEFNLLSSASYSSFSGENVSHRNRSGQNFVLNPHF